MSVDLQRILPLVQKSLTVFRPHHLELRRRVILVLLCVVFCSGVAWFFSEQLTRACVAPLLDASPRVGRLVYTSLPEAFLARVKLSLLTGLIASMPVLFYHGYAFITPGLKEKEKRVAVPLAAISTLLFACGALLGWFVLLPLLLGCFMSYAAEGLQPLPKLGGYISFVVRMLSGCGLAFEIPFLVLVADRTGLFSIEKMRRGRIWFSAAAIFVAFLLAGGDLMATLLLTLPLSLLYEAGIFCAALFNR